MRHLRTCTNRAKGRTCGCSPDAAHQHKPPTPCLKGPSLHSWTQEYGTGKKDSSTQHKFHINFSFQTFDGPSDETLLLFTKV